MNRRHNDIEPTAAGYAVLKHARSVLRDVEHLDAELRGFASGGFGLIRIHAAESAVFGAVPEAPKSFLDQYPMVRVELEEATSPCVVRAVLENRADLGLYVGELSATGLKRFRIYSDRLTVLLPASHPLAHRTCVHLHELLDDEFIGQEADSMIEHLTQTAARQAGRVIKSRIRVTGFDAACRMVEAGLGIAITAERITAKFAPVMRLRQLKLGEGWAVRPHYACVRKGAPLSTVTRRLVEHLSASIGEHDQLEAVSPPLSVRDR